MISVVFWGMAAFGVGIWVLHNRERLAARQRQFFPDLWFLPSALSRAWLLGVGAILWGLLLIAAAIYGGVTGTGTFYGDPPH